MKIVSERNFFPSWVPEASPQPVGSVVASEGIHSRSGESASEARRQVPAQGDVSGAKKRPAELTDAGVIDPLAKYINPSDCGSMRLVGRAWRDTFVPTAAAAALERHLGATSQVGFKTALVRNLRAADGAPGAENTAPAAGDLAALVAFMAGTPLGREALGAVTSLNLYAKAVGDEDLPALARACPNVKHLQLNDTWVIDVSAPLAQMTNLETLDLRHTEVLRIGGEMAALTRLESLNLNASQVAQIDDIFGEMPNLSELCIVDAAIRRTELPLSVLENPRVTIHWRQPHAT